jgi:hypothetical protein
MSGPENVVRKTRLRLRLQKACSDNLTLQGARPHLENGYFYRALPLTGTSAFLARFSRFPEFSPENRTDSGKGFVNVW